MESKILVNCLLCSMPTNYSHGWLLHFRNTSWRFAKEFFPDLSLVAWGAWL